MPPRARATLHLSAGDSGKTVVVDSGTVFDVELMSPRAAGARYDWRDAVLEGASVVAHGNEILDPPGNVDGGSFRHVHTFAAVGVGTTRLRIVPEGDDVV